MKKLSIALVVIALLGGTLALKAQDKAEKALPYKTDSENFSYMVGLQVAQSFEAGRHQD